MESIAVFLTSDIDYVSSELFNFGVKGSDIEKLFFDGVEGSNLYLCLYPFVDEDEDVRVEVVGVEPKLEFKTVLGIDVGRSSNSWLACLKLIASLVEKFQGGILIDDSVGDYWRPTEINSRTKKKGKEFLEPYIGRVEIERIWNNLA
ncbi:hypothetical protein EDC56_0122 [Sinobacterium caligoides]|uniref:Uncharacterized protein n=1 Tax=Sinobacterium caligoides TaxID=933926 RepID=A0A3N2DXN7_9GAMM|nr:hypothetical protein [Sinobacterium caligoides]ROS04616.1 hypothetical protein EDC56_0122 [Sinobacterium caligoides]